MTFSTKDHMFVATGTGGAETREGDMIQANGPGNRAGGRGIMSLQRFGARRCAGRDEHVVLWYLNSCQKWLDRQTGCGVVWIPGRAG